MQQIPKSQCVSYIRNVFSSRISLPCPVGWGCRIHQLLLCRGVRPSQWVSWYDTKKSDGEVQVMLEFWGMRNTPSLPLILGPLWLRVVAPDKVLSMVQIELSCVLTLNWVVRNRTVFDIETVYLSLTKLK